MDAHRISDADRDHVIATLQRSRASGHIDQATLTDRVRVATATHDPLELYGLLNDLPDLTTSTWTPSPHQQLTPYGGPATGQPAAPAPYQPMPPTPAWREFLQRHGATIAIGLLVAALFIGFGVVGNTGASGWWWWIIFGIIITQRRWRRWGNKPPAQPGGWQPNQPPPPTQDRFDSDDQPGQDGQWHQPPR